MTDEATRDQLLELAATLLLALAAIATAWATYPVVGLARQPGRGAERVDRRTRRVHARRRRGHRQAQVDVALFTQWIDAYVRDQGALSSFYRRRFRDEFEPAFNAWVATRPRTNPNAALSPFAMPQYRLAASTKADALERQAAAYSLVVSRDVNRADNYMLAVVLFAISLFFAAVSTRLRSRDLRIAILAAGYVLFLGTAVWLATQPVSV